MNDEIQRASIVLSLLILASAVDVATAEARKLPWIPPGCHEVLHAEDLVPVPDPGQVDQYFEPACRPVAAVTFPELTKGSLFYSALRLGDVYVLEVCRGLELSAPMGIQWRAALYPRVRLKRGTWTVTAGPGEDPGWILRFISKRVRSCLPPVACLP